MSCAGLFKDKRVMRLGGGMLLLLVGLLGFMRKVEHASHGSLAPQEGLGWGLFEQSNRFLDGYGTIQILACDEDPSVETLSTFKTLLRDAKGMTLLDVVTLEGRYDETQGDEPLDAGHFILCLEAIPDADLVITFGGLPRLTKDEIVYVESLGAHFVSVSLDGILPDERWLSSGLLKALILPKLQKVPLSTFLPSTPTEWFEREYDLITTVQELRAWE
ncbi:hypothetical protein P3T73_00140 [Kiritimatiellota bacterium B12222]|nr:hypothetical protein P3T73_00140 [Kiritimatiellota bacterium B12222]